MKVAIVSADTFESDALGFAAERRGHQTLVFDKVERLYGQLPFTPDAVVVAIDAGPSTSDRIRRLRENFPASALFLTSERDDGTVRGAALIAGAHNVIRAPYNPHEVVLTLERWLDERQVPAGAQTSIRVGDLEVALERYQAIKNGQTLTLTKLELRILYCLCEHFPHVTPTERMLTFGWEALHDPDVGLLKTHISHIRHKLNAAGGDAMEIVSRHTVGYALQMLDAA